jgi:hypothetical protein
VKIFSLLVLLLATACALTPPTTEERTVNNIATQPATPEQPPATPTAAPVNTVTPQVALPETTPVIATQDNPALWVKILSPEDGATVTTQKLKVTGQAPPETVITINDEIILVPQDASFEVEIILEEGSNLIEVVASDLSGNEIYLPITVIYEP